MTNNTIMVWDWYVRVFHWGLVFSFIFSYVTQSEYYTQHIYAGYVVFCFVLFRLFLGVFGSKYVRFSNMLVSPKTAVNYVLTLVRGRSQVYVGHNPMGGYMTVFLLLSLLFIVISGVMLDAAENRSGPLSGYRLFLYTDKIKIAHQFSTDFSLGLVLIHVCWLILKSWISKHCLFASMVTGRKNVD